MDAKTEWSGEGGLPPLFTAGSRSAAGRPAASAGAHRQDRRRPLGAADRPHRRGQDACRIPALARRSPPPRQAKPGTGFHGVHTLYISPLKALAVDIERNLERPVAEMGLPVTIETRTGDTPQHKRSRKGSIRPISC